MSSDTAVARARVLSTRTISRAEPRCIRAMAEAEPTAPTPIIPTFILGPPCGDPVSQSSQLGNAGVQPIQRRDEEETPSNGATEVQQAIVGARRTADEHVLEHLLNRSRGARVA